MLGVHKVWEPWSEAITIICGRRLRPTLTLLVTYTKQSRPRQQAGDSTNKAWLWRKPASHFLDTQSFLTIIRHHCELLGLDLGRKKSHSAIHEGSSDRGPKANTRPVCVRRNELFSGLMDSRPPSPRPPISKLLAHDGRMYCGMMVLYEQPTQPDVRNDDPQR